MQIEIGEHLAALLVATPWAVLAALLVWPDTGVFPLLIKRNQAVRVAEIERDGMKTDIAIAAKRGTAEPRLPAPIGESE